MQNMKYGNIEDVIRITMIDSNEGRIKRFLGLKHEVSLEIQPIRVAPFYDGKIDNAVQNFSPDLIITDLRLTRDADSGYSTIRHYREKFPDTPIICWSNFISFNQEDNYRKKAILNGATDALPTIPFPSSADLLKYIPKYFSILMFHGKITSMYTDKYDKPNLQLKLFD